MDVREVTINTNKDIALVLNKHTPEGQKLNYEQCSNFKTYLLAKFGKKFTDNDNLTVWKVDFMNALNMCRAKDNWPTSDFQFSDEEFEGMLQALRAEYKRASVVRKEREEHLKRVIELYSGYSTSDPEFLFAKKNFAHLDLAAYLEHVVTEGDPEERERVFECLRYISINYSELMLLLPDEVFSWFACPWGKAVHRSTTKLPRLIAAFQRATVCSPAVKDWYTANGKQFKDMSRLLESNEAAIPTAELFAGLDYQTAREWFYADAQHINSLPAGSIEQTQKTKWLDEAKEWLAANKDSRDRTTSEYMLSAGAGFAADMLAEGLTCGKAASTVSKANDSNDALSFVKDIPLASIRNCETSEELYELLSRFKGGI